MYDEQENIKGAILLFDQALKIDPNHSDSL